MLNYIGRIKGAVAWDAAIASTLLHRFGLALSNIGMIFVVSFCLNRIEQGIYYTMNSLIGLQVFFELGVNFAVVQLVAHEMARIDWRGGCLEGDTDSKKRLASIVVYCARWILWVCPCCILLIGPSGYLFLSHGGVGGLKVFGTWFAMAIITGGNLIINMLLAVLEGANQMADVAYIRLLQVLVSSLVAGCGLFFGLGLMAIALGLFSSAVLGFCLVWFRYASFFYAIWEARDQSMRVSFANEIWPFQWRIAISWACGYLIFQAFVPMLFAFHGPVEAGQLGMTLQITGGITSVASVWVSTRAPIFARYIALNDMGALRAAFRAVFWRSVILMILACGLVALGIWFVQTRFPDRGSRILPIWAFLVLCVVALANHINASQAFLLRCFKKEPFLIVSIANAVIIFGLSFLLIPEFGYNGALVAYGCGAFFANVMLGGYVFWRRYRNLQYV